MPSGSRSLCVLCAWRGTCAKRFSLAEGTLHCPDFSEDVLLRREREKGAAGPAPSDKEES